MERKLAVYFYHLMDPRIPGHRQVDAYVAAASQKRAAELLNCTAADIRTFGGITHQSAVQEMCRTEPETVFVKVSHGVFSRIDEYSQEDKRITLNMRDEDLYGVDTEHPAFGQIEISRVGGRANLFGVDYPLDHYIILRINRATLNRNLASDRIMPENEIIRVALSEVQFARLITSPNSGGVACTLQQYFDPDAGEMLTPKLPDKHVADAETFKEEVKNRATRAVEGLDRARNRLREILSGPLRKSDLNEVDDLLRAAAMMMKDNLPYVVGRAEETIDEAVGAAKAEVNAHIDLAMQKLGERALGDRLAEALAAGADLSQIGRNVARAMDEPEPILIEQKGG